MTAKPTILLLLPILVFASLSVGAQNALGPGALPVGSWWSLQYAYHDQTDGNGKYAGHYTDDANGTVTLTVTDQSGTAISIKRHWAGNAIDYSSTAQGPYWSAYIGGTARKEAPPGSTVATNQGSVAFPDKTYTLDLSSQMAVRGTGYGSISYLLQPHGLTVGSTVTKGWWNTAGDWVGVPFTVTEYQPILIQGANVNAFTLTYTGQTLGIGTGSMNATGPATENYAYDAAYGVLLTTQYSGTYTLSDTAGKFTERESWNYQVVATSISFPTQAATTASSIPFDLFTPTTLGVLVGALIALVIGAYAVTRRTKPGHRDIERVKRCQVCHSELPADAIFCGECGHPIT